MPRQNLLRHLPTPKHTPTLPVYLHAQPDYGDQLNDLVNRSTQDTAKFWIAATDKSSGEDDEGDYVDTDLLVEKGDAATADAATSSSSSSSSSAIPLTCRLRDSNFNAQLIDRHQLHLTYTPTNTSSLLLAPTRTYKSIHQHAPEAATLGRVTGKPVFSISVTPSAGASSSDGIATDDILSGSTDGDLKYWRSNGTVIGSLDGHVGDVNVVNFIPQHPALALSGGMDTQIKLWAVDKCKCVMTLKSHQRPVTAVHPLQGGKQIVSSSTDGTVRLYDTAQQKEIKCSEAIAELNHSVLLPTAVDPTSIASSSTVLAAGADGNAHMFDLRTMYETQLLICSTDGVPVTRVHAIDNTTVAAGLENGTLFVVDLRTYKPLRHWRKNDASITSFMSWQEHGLWVSNNLGEVDLYNDIVQSPATTSSSSSAAAAPADPLTTAPTVAASLMGADCEPVYQLATADQKHIYGAAFGAVRRYDLTNARLPT